MESNTKKKKKKQKKRQIYAINHNRLMMLSRFKPTVSIHPLAYYYHRRGKKFSTLFPTVKPHFDLTPPPCAPPSHSLAGSTLWQGNWKTQKVEPSFPLLIVFLSFLFVRCFRCSSTPLRFSNVAMFPSSVLGRRSRDNGVHNAGNSRSRRSNQQWVSVS